MTIIPDRRDRLAKMSEKGLLVERDCLAAMAQVMTAVIDNPKTPKESAGYGAGRQRRLDDVAVLWRAG